MVEAIFMYAGRLPRYARNDKLVPIVGAGLIKHTDLSSAS
jgi:hypothetical protein